MRRWLVIVGHVLVMLVMLAQPQVSGAQGNGQTHVVRQGETLSSIARQFGVSVDALIAANHLADGNMLYVGERLVIPGDPPQRTSQPALSAPGTYTVQSGDTLSRIAGRLGVDAYQLAAANKIADPSMLQVGQVLKIPGLDLAAPSVPVSVPVSPLPDGLQTAAPSTSGPSVNFQIVNGSLVSLTLQTVSTGKQSLPLSCEAKIAAQLAMMYGLNFDEASFQSRLPHSLNPQRGFVGSVNGRFYWPSDIIGGNANGPGGYGVHVEGWAPTFQALSGFQVRFLSSAPATARTQIDAALRHGYPVAVWAILGFRAQLTRNSLWVGPTADGTAINCGGPAPDCFFLASGEHAYLILGRTGDSYVLYDPGSGEISNFARDMVITGITTLFAAPTGSAPGAVIVPAAGHTPDLSKLPGWQ